MWEETLRVGKIRVGLSSDGKSMLVNGPQGYSSICIFEGGIAVIPILESPIL